MLPIGTSIRLISDEYFGGESEEEQRNLQRNIFEIVDAQDFTPFGDTIEYVGRQIDPVVDHYDRVFDHNDVEAI